jgi:hypothetical protein
MHFTDLIAENPLPECTDSMFEWSVFIHNLVNARLGKPVISEEQAIEALQGGGKRTGTIDIRLIIAVIILVLLLFFFIAKK